MLLGVEASFMAGQFLIFHPSIDLLRNGSAVESVLVYVSFSYSSINYFVRDLSLCSSDAYCLLFTIASIWIFVLLDLNLHLLGCHGSQ